MSTNRTHAIATTGWSDAPLRRAPLKRHLSVPEPRGTAAPSGIAELFEAFTRLLMRKPRETGGSKEPPDGARRDFYWDDPALWMLMLH